MVMNARKLEDAESNSFKKLLECEEEAKNQEMEKNNLLNILLECEKEKNNLKNDLEKAKNELEKAQKPEQRTIIICEGDDGEIRCENPKTLKIESAIFGRSESQADVCPFSGTSIDNTNCRLDVLYRLSDLCDDKTRCPIPSTKSEFGDVDPCPGTYKYVEVTYTCA
ncbi:L-rhamnose-binding lectin ELEL-1-like [Saccostrea echinata]|uniref:L-rhamnose-binding lectin ELEL-1-like n=1 Tax=Saccostrea echinata TaxID=191078 RepID=UPI002A8145AC|nr:L-rhamnose-binding lectin ELEL-1-like [Saccostrea echinata]